MSQDLSDTFGTSAASALRGLLPRRPAANEQRSTPGSVERGSDPVEEFDADDVLDQDADTSLDEDEDQDEFGDQEKLEDDDDLFEDGAESRATGGQDARRRRPSTVRRSVAPPAPRTAPGATPAPGRAPAPRMVPRRDSGAPGRPTRAAAGTWRVSRIAARGHIDLLVLLALRQGPADGRDVIARLHAGSGGALQLPEQTVYRTLHRLTRNRLVLRRRDPVVPRARYVLSETGERVWRSRLGQWQAFVRAVDAIARVGDEK